LFQLTEIETDKSVVYPSELAHRCLAYALGAVPFLLLYTQQTTVKLQ